jgi:predicted AlkP superfamily pyrophosphatase or phosphodiesterase
MRYFYCLLALLLSYSVYGKSEKPTVILLSIDGFSYEYLEQYKPSNLLTLAKSGAVAELLPVYPSKTFPNHLSIITGSYPINHGISNNNFYNSALGKKYVKGAGKNNPAWLTAEPFWYVAMQQDIKAAVYFWPESEIIGKTPTYNIPFNKKDSNKARFTQIIKWLELPAADRPRFIASYFSTVDSAGHHYGPKSKQVAKAIADIDILLGEFLSTLATDIDQDINLIIVSDHGMIQVDKNKAIKPSMVFDQKTDELIKSDAIIVASNDTQLFVYFNSLKLEQPEERFQVIDRLKLKLKQQTPNRYQLYSKGSYPKHWHLDKDIDLVPDIIIEAIPPATFVKEKYNKKLTISGTHGYDPKNQASLAGIFIASGTNIVKGIEVEPFENIHIFSFMSELLNINESSVIDGNKAVLAPLIIKK